jgi:hypothetical protein
MGCRAIKRRAIDRGATVGRSDLEGMKATGPRGCETNPLRGGRGDLGGYWRLSDLEQVVCRSLATLDTKSKF